MTLAAGNARHGGFDYLRVVAIVLVFIQHAMAVQGHYEATTQFGVNLGQAGVGIFCAISGYLAFSGRDGDPASWLKRRLLTVFPAYWIVTLVGFGLTLVVGEHKLTFFQFLSQMLGTGYFTHGWELVNVVSWFISLILLCYLLAYAVKLSRRELGLLTGITLVCAMLVAARLEVSLSRHVLTFSLAALFAIYRRRHGYATLQFLVVPVLLGVAALQDPQFAYAEIALLTLGTALMFHWAISPVITQASRYSYEFFLIHGIFLVGAAKATMLLPTLQVAAALAASVVSAPLLRAATGRLGAAIRPTGT